MVGAGQSDVEYVANGHEVVGAVVGDIGGVSFIADHNLSKAIKLLLKNKEHWVKEIEDIAGMSCNSNLTFPDSIELLNDSEIWIGDTGASIHSGWLIKGSWLILMVSRLETANI